VRFFSFLLLALGLSFSAAAQSSDDDEVLSAEVPVLDTAEAVELTEAEIDALVEARKEKRRAVQKNRNKLGKKRYTRELLALVMLCVLWLLTRKHERDIDANRPVRVSPVSPEELGRAIFGILRSKDAMAYRALYLTGGEARELFGAAGVEVYLEARTGSKLAASMEALARRVPVGAQYRGCYIKEEVCHLQLLGSDGGELTLPAGRVALVGAVIRLVSPASD